MSPWRQIVRALVVNLRTGLRIGTLRRFEPAQLQVDARQAALLMLVALGLDFLTDFIHVGTPREFNIWGVMSHLANYSLFMLAVYLVTQIQGQLERYGMMVVALLAAEPVEWGANELYRIVLKLTNADGNLWLAWAAYALLLAWFYAICFRVQRHVFATSRLRTAVAAAIYIGVMLASSMGLPYSELWYQVYDDEEKASRVRLDVEATYYAQPQLLSTALKNLQPQRPGIPDIYFVGMAGWAEQDVFLREVRSVRQLFDARFDTEGRSLLLINNPATVSELPLANASNLQQVLNHIGGLMDPKEDMLFLYVTSHGSEKSGVAMNYWPLSLNDISAARLSEILSASAIEWRTVVLSACYSGRFIPTLQDAKSMVLTASAADRQSFGCDNKNTWTYFGEAYFDQALSHSYSFVTAFDEASRAITDREKREKLEPSLPQSWIGEEIANFLPRLENRFATLNGGIPQTVAECGEGATVTAAACR